MRDLFEDKYLESQTYVTAPVAHLMTSNRVIALPEGLGLWAQNFHYRGGMKAMSGSAPDTSIWRSGSKLARRLRTLG